MIGIIAALLSMQDNRGISPDDRARWKEEAFAGAQKAYKQFNSWKATVGIQEPVPGGEGIDTYDGTVCTKAADDKDRMLYWELKKWETAGDGRRVDLETQRCLCRGLDLRIALDGEKVLENYRLDALDRFFPQMLLREGLTRNLEKYFAVEILHDPRHAKLVPDKTDWIHLGFKDQKEFEEWRRDAEGTVNGTVKTGKSEFDELRRKDEKFREANPNYRKEPPGGDAARLWYYRIRLTPVAPPLKDDARSILWTLRPGDFLTVSMDVTLARGGSRMVALESIVKDPTGQDEIKDERFQLDAPGYVQRRPRRE